MKSGHARMDFLAIVLLWTSRHINKQLETVIRLNINTTCAIKEWICMNVNIFIRLFCLIFVVSNCKIAFSQSELASSSITLRGQSSGGVLTLMKAPGGNYPFIVVTNKPNESAASVIDKLLFQLTNCSVCAAWYGVEYVSKPTTSTLVLLGGPISLNESSSWILGGTDTGFNIPPPPLFVSVSYKSGKVALEWVNPPGGYDSIVIVCGGVPVSLPLPGNSTRWTNDQDGVLPSFNSYSKEQMYMVVGYKNGTPSNGSGVRLTNLNKMESLMNIPFTQGVAPSFKKWSYDSPIENIDFRQGNLPGMMPNTEVAQLDGKGFYQIISGHGTFVGGISRRFLGLIPGHSYKVTARINTFGMAKGKWSVSLHAAYNAATGEDLTSAQMAGAAELPDKGNGAVDGEIAKYDSTTTTDGKWVDSPSKLSTSETVKVITLPNGINSITVWLKHDGTEVTGSMVGIDSVTIEDVRKSN